MFRILTIFSVSLMLSACGGDADSARGLEKIVNLYNRMGQTYKENSLSISGVNSERSIASRCHSVTPVSVAELQASASEINEHGACFDDYSSCTYVTGDAMLTTTLFGREFRAITPSGDYSGVVTTDLLLTGSFKSIAGQKVAVCDDNVEVTIPDIVGVYEGYRYDIDSSKTLDKQTLIRSEKIVMDCLNSICVPRDDAVIRVFTSNGFNLTASDSEKGAYILTQFSTRDNTRGYQFWGTATDNGRTITGLAFPVGTGAGYSECNAGECFFLSFYKVM